MKKFLLKVLLFFAIVVLVDVLSEFGFSYLRGHAKGGSTANNEYIANKSSEDIIILGSSRATHHYNPQILSDSLGLSCYNCGEEGNGVILAYGRYKMITSRYKPKLIIYEVTPGFDYYQWDSYNKYLGYLRPYYNNTGIKDIFEDFDDELSFIKMRSSMYQNNSRLLQDIVDNITFRDNKKGYSPLYGELKIPSDSKIRSYILDSLKLSYLHRLCVEANKDHIPFVMAVSPVYCNAESSELYREAFKISKKYGIPLLDYRDYPQISNDASLFQDPVHMNEKGADLYTSLIANNVRQVVEH